MRLVIVTAVLAVVLSACGGSTATGPRTQVSSNASRTTATPGPTAGPAKPGPVLLDAKGSASDRTTAAFTAHSSWTAHYSFKCMAVNPQFGHGVLQIYGIDPRHPDGQETIVLYALTTAVNGPTNGTSDPVDAGRYRLRILADPVCSWHVVVREV